MEGYDSALLRQVVATSGEVYQMAPKQRTRARKRARPGKVGNAATVGYEAELWQMADARGIWE